MSNDNKDFDANVATHLHIAIEDITVEAINSGHIPEVMAVLEMTLLKVLYYTANPHDALNTMHARLDHSMTRLMSSWMDHIAECEECREHHKNGTRMAAVSVGDTMNKLHKDHSH